jgi:hypothetical protein
MARPICYTGPGVTLAWAHLARRHRGFDARCRAHRRRTRRVRRVEHRRHRSLHAARADAAAAQRDGRPIDARIPRAQFAISRAPSFGCSGPLPKRPRAAKLVVYYLGIPDTTPEFATEAALEAYLASRISQGEEAMTNALTRGELARLLDHSVLKPGSHRSGHPGGHRHRARVAHRLLLRPALLGGARGASLEGTSTKVASVIGFPHGADRSDVKASATALAVVTALRRSTWCRTSVRSAAACRARRRRHRSRRARACGIPVKVILEPPH